MNASPVRQGNTRKDAGELSRDQLRERGEDGISCEELERMNMRLDSFLRRRSIDREPRNVPYDHQPFIRRPQEPLPEFHLSVTDTTKHCPPPAQPEPSEILAAMTITDPTQPQPDPLAAKDVVTILLSERASRRLALEGAGAFAIVARASYPQFPNRLAIFCKVLEPELETDLGLILRGSHAAKPKRVECNTKHKTRTSHNSLE